MKIILSRKGFDSSVGGIPSPILEDGTMLPLPIPSKLSPIPYCDLRLHRHDLGRVVEDLGAKKITATSGAHHDPDLVAGARKRLPGWRPLFGQADAEVTVLRNAGVGEGDLFLFFGWFRRAELKDSGYRFIRGSEDIHALWGWLQIERSWNLSEGEPVPPWAADHPHLDPTRRAQNILFDSKPQLELAGAELPGAGVFRWDERLRLTAPGRTRSIWRLLGWFYPNGRSLLGYHKEERRWTVDKDRTILKSVARGQEFVLDAEQYPEAVEWVSNLLGKCYRSGEDPISITNTPR